MNRQKTLASASTFGKYKKSTKREKFLAEMERVVPWKELYAVSPKKWTVKTHEYLPFS